MYLLVYYDFALHYTYISVLFLLIQFSSNNIWMFLAVQQLFMSILLVAAQRSEDGSNVEKAIHIFTNCRTKTLQITGLNIYKSPNEKVSNYRKLLDFF